MATDDRKFVRVYYDDLIRDYGDVWYDDTALAAYIRLLSTADPMWPTPPELPRSVKAKALALLKGRGLVVAMPRDRFGIKGLDAERTKRANAARNAAASRWGNADRNAPASDTPMPNPVQSNPSQNEPNARETPDGRVDIEAFLMVTRRAPTTRQRALLDGILDRRDLTGPQWAADIIMRNPDDPIGAIIAADKEWRDARIAEAQAAEKPKPQPRRPRGLPESTKELLEHWAKTEGPKILAQSDPA